MAVNRVDKFLMYLDNLWVNLVLVTEQLFLIFDPKSWATWAVHVNLDARGIDFVLTYPIPKLIPNPAQIYVGIDSIEISGKGLVANNPAMDSSFLSRVGQEMPAILALYFLTYYFFTFFCIFISLI